MYRWWSRVHRDFGHDIRLPDLLLTLAVLLASNCAAFRNITLHWLQALNGVS
jgi:hypothetical protein